MVRTESGIFGSQYVLLDTDLSLQPHPDFFFLYFKVSKLLLIWRYYSITFIIIIIKGTFAKSVII